MISDHAINAIQRAALHKQLEENFLQTVVSLANAMDARDSYTGDHSQRMVDLSTALSFEMNLDKDQIEAVHWAALLHDIGKIGVPDEILNKAGPLTDQEWNIMKQHPEMGSEILGPVNMLSDVAPIIQAHHEDLTVAAIPTACAENKSPSNLASSRWWMPTSPSATTESTTIPTPTKKPSQKSVGTAAANLTLK